MKVWSLGLVSMHWYTVFSHFCHLFACCHFYYRITKSPFTIHITCILPSLRRTSAPLQLTIVLGVLGTQETSCILIAGLLERDICDLYLPEFDKPWVTHLRENCRCPTNLGAWRPNKSKRIEVCSRHQGLVVHQRGAGGGSHGAGTTPSHGQRWGRGGHPPQLLEAPL